MVPVLWAKILGLSGSGTAYVPMYPKWQFNANYPSGTEEVLSTLEFLGRAGTRR